MAGGMGILGMLLSLHVFRSGLVESIVQIVTQSDSLAALL